MKNDTELCEWLRANSSGTYWPSYQAADRIEELLVLVSKLDELEAKQEIFVTHMAEVKAIADGNNTNKLTDVVAHCLKELKNYNIDMQTCTNYYSALDLARVLCLRSRKIKRGE